MIDFKQKTIWITGASSGNLTLTNTSVSFGNIDANRITTNEIIEKVDIKGDLLTGTHNVNLAWLFECFRHKQFQLRFCTTDQQAADIFTKHFI